MKFPILNRFTRETICEIELDASYEYKPRSVQLGAAVKIAFSKNINLTYAKLTEANLAGANLTHADLTYANLAWADLAGAKLAGADLTCADLTYTNLAGADLTHADLTCAYLAHAKLAGADLTCAYLTYTNLADADLAGQGILQINGLRWPVLVTPANMTIGCEQHSHDDWRGFDDRRILQMADKTGLKFWAENKNWLFERCVWATGFQKKEDTA